MDEEEWIETVEIDAERFVSLEFARQWPRYVVTWTVRRRVGDGDFPLARGTAEDLPRSGGSVEALWDDLRGKALQGARRAAAEVQSQPATEQRSLWQRLFGSRR